MESCTFSVEKHEIALYFWANLFRTEGKSFSNHPWRRGVGQHSLMLDSQLFPKVNLKILKLLRHLKICDASCWNFLGNFAIFLYINPLANYTRFFANKVCYGPVANYVEFEGVFYMICDSRYRNC